jgi:flagellin-like hook-associated protein FlgL
MADINLTKAVRSNLLSLQSTAAQMTKTQERLATGLKVNSALDNPTNFFTAASLNSRASDMGNLLDSMSNGISTIEAADNGLSSITKTVESMQSAIRQARQDKSFKGESLAVKTGTPLAAAKFTIDVDGAGSIAAVDFGTAAKTTTAGAVFGTPVAGDLTLTDGSGGTATITLAATDDINETIALINGNADAKSMGITAGKDTAGTSLTLTSANGRVITTAGANSTATTTGFTAAAQTMTLGAASTVDQLASNINNDKTVNTKVRASNDNGKLRIENLQTSTKITVGGLNASGEIDQTATGSGTKDVSENTVRADLIKQFNDLRQQLDRTAEDASFNGINLLRGDALKLTFNETGSSSLTVQAKDGKAINATNLGIEAQNNTVADTDAALDLVLADLGDALGSLRSQSSAFGSNLSMVENRQDFTKNMINTLETGAGNLTLADTNEEAANLLALQTRQQLSSTALSMASQADQAVLRLF